MHDTGLSGGVLAVGEVTDTYVCGEIGHVGGLSRQRDILCGVTFFHAREVLLHVMYWVTGPK